ncbi:DUF2790 domain-containing protein [Pseudomonas fluorescens]|uniref:DUF2790 domain-containing protein n=1 Tax=Pseudomonas fluorescens TaxID=294 RepID=UPI00209B858C|nr:DUF2790 domain-containing protein [Pseudomonas fluorescens]MCO7624904.1 DUF2790 domain-containing protein [Pseudomonas fluorescens]
MRILKLSICFALSFVVQLGYAQSQSDADKAKIERANKVALETYANQVGKSVPEVKDYSYGMKLDIAKTIHISPPVKYCGNIKSYMSYQDSKGELHSIRYIEQGDCPQKR